MTVLRSNARYRTELFYCLMGAIVGRMLYRICTSYVQTLSKLVVMATVCTGAMYTSNYHQIMQCGDILLERKSKLKA